LNVLHAPKSIPKDIKMIREEELPPPSTGVIGGVAGGMAGGSLGGILGGTGLGTIAPPPVVKKETPKGPQRIGGNVMQANLIRQVKPQYPPLARQARISGTVVFSAVISKEGTIENLALVSGHPLLVQAAREAVSQWVYKPTLLNGDAVEVATTISVNFTLSGQ
jgi:protein TonB